MHEVSFAIKRTHWNFVKFYNRILEPMGITDARLQLLHAIDAKDAPWQSELAHFLGCTPQCISEMLDSLEELGLITRTDGEVDRRKKFISLTPACRELLKRVHAIYLRSGLVNKLAARAFIDIPSKPQKIATALALTKDSRKAMLDRSWFKPPRGWEDEIDGGKPLKGVDRQIYDDVVDYCRERFQHLPWDYLMATW
jgi:DNA-binding MarR family transcriptional regulator